MTMGKPNACYSAGVIKTGCHLSFNIQSVIDNRLKKQWSAISSWWQKSTIDSTQSKLELQTAVATESAPTQHARQ